MSVYSTVSNHNQDFSKISQVDSPNDKIKQSEILSSQEFTTHSNLSKIDEININSSKNQSQLKKRKCLFGLFFLFLTLGILCRLLFKLFKKQKQQIEYRIFNQQFLNQPFGKTKQTVSNIFQMEFQKQEISLNSFYLEDRSLMIPKSVLKKNSKQFTSEQIENYLSNSIAFETYSFKFNNSFEKKKEKQVSHMKEESQIKDKFNLVFNKQKYNEKIVLSSIALQQNSENNQKIDSNEQLEYFYADNKYAIGKQKKQVPICIFSEGPKVEKQEMIAYLESIDKLNYSNFHVVYVNQFSTDFSPKNVFTYLNQSQMRLRNRIKIVNNMQYLGTLANIYFWVKRFCGQEDIVFIVGKDESIIGRQTLKVLNSFYQSAHIWHSFSDYLEISSAKTTDHNSKTTDFSRSGSHLRSFRRKLLDSIPLQSLIEYKFDKTTGQAWPSFYRCQLDDFPDYLQFTNVAKQRNGHLNQFLLLTRQKQQVCSKERLNFHKQLMNMRTPLRPVFLLGQLAEVDRNDSISKKKMKAVKNASSALFNCKKQELNKRFYKITVYNQNNKEKFFGKSSNTMINLTNYIPQTRDIWKSIRVGQTKSQDDAIYVLTPTDLNKLIEKIDFWKYKEELWGQFPYQILQFQNHSSLEKAPPLLQFKHFKSDDEIQNYLKKLRNQNSQQSDDPSFNLAVEMEFNPTKQQVLEAEFYYYNKRYNFSEKTNELPICIFCSEFNLFKKNQYKQFFDSVQRLNYSNYHIIYIDDFSTDDSAYNLYDFVKNGNYSRTRNRMKIIHNLQNTGGLGNLFYWPQKLCNQNDIVVNIDGDDAALGTQSFKVLSSVYEDQNIWYVHSFYLIHDPQKNFIIRGIVSAPLDIKASEYRRSRKFMSSHIRSFRAKLMKAVPLYQFLDFHYNKTTKMAWPTFQALGYDTTQVHSHFQLAGNQRIKFLPDFLYSYYGSASTRNCYILHQRFDQIKATVKVPLQQINSLDERGKQQENKEIPQFLYKYPGELNDEAMKKGCFKP